MKGKRILEEGNLSGRKVGRGDGRDREEALTRMDQNVESTQGRKILPE